MNRRQFIQQAAAGGILALGWPLKFSWAVAPTANVQPLKIVFYTDVHARPERGAPDAMALAAEAINAQRANLVLCGGDMIAGGIESSVESIAPRWDLYKKMHQAIKPEPVVVLGNHDLVGVEPDDGSAPVADPRGDAREKLGIKDTYRAFDFNGYHFILLDCTEITANEDGYRGYVWEEQMTWLQHDLGSVDKKTPIVLLCHMPLLTAFYQGTLGIETHVPPDRGVVNNLEVLAAFAEHNLLLVLQGHLHVNEMMRWQKTTFITGGAISGRWWRGNWHGTDPGYGVLNLSPDRVDWEYHTYGWKKRSG